jgi:hypothetical protein
MDPSRGKVTPKKSSIKRIFLNWCDVVKIETYFVTSTFIPKHWRGEYSLRRSFWLNTVVISWFIPLSTLTLFSANTFQLPTRIASIAFVIVFGMFSPSLMWGLVGTARASKIYQERGGRKSWATAAVLVTMLLLLDSLFFFLNTRGISVDHFRMAFTGIYGPPASVSVVNSGEGLILTGPLQVGSAEELAVEINKAPSVKVIILNSKGGLLQEAALLAKNISQRGLDTYVNQECSSACTFVFLAGKNRCLAPGARVGFHAAIYVHDLSRKTFQNLAGIQRDLYIKAGLPEPFVSEIMETPNSRVWYPSRKELLEAHVTTQGCM